MTQSTGKIAIVTGAGSGIGRATSRRFVNDGMIVYGLDLSAEGLAETVRACSEGAGSFNPVEGNAADEGDLKSLAKTIGEKHGRIDVAFANAGIGGPTGTDATPEEFRNVINVNLVGPYLLFKYCLPFMEGNDASFIMTASVAGIRGNAAAVPYSASKGGVIAMANSMAFGAYGKRVRVNAICPGLIDTQMYPKDEIKRERGGDGGNLSPLQRVGDPSEIASVAAFLAGPDSSYINGQALVVCGGVIGALPNTPGGSA